MCGGIVNVALGMFKVGAPQARHAPGGNIPPGACVRSIVAAAGYAFGSNGGSMVRSSVPNVPSSPSTTIT
jgi:hypothetical protein